MKYSHIFVILAFTMCALSSCQRQTNIPEKLLRIEKHMDKNPQQALDELNRLSPEYKDAPVNVRMKLTLLKIKAADKSLILQKSDRTMLKLVKYYDKYGTVNERMEAYYYLGSAYRDLHDSPKTIKNYCTAIDFADTTETDFDWELYAVINTQLAGLYDRLYRYDDAITTQKRAVQIETDHDIDSLYTINTLGVMYENADSIEQAGRYYGKYLSLIQKRGMTEKDITLIGALIGFYSRHNYSALAELCHSMIFRYPLSKWPVNTISAVGDYYEHIGKSDSALYYYTYADGCYGTDIYRRRSSLGNLYRFHLEQGNDREALRYAQLYMVYNDSVEHDRALEQTNQAEGMYQYYKNKKQQIEQERETYRNYMFGTLALVTLLLLALAFMIISRRRRKRLMKAVAENNSLLQEKIRLQSEVSDSRQRLGSIIAERRQEKSLQNQMVVDFSDIVRTFKLKGRSGEEMTDAGAWESFFATIDHQYPDFKGHIGRIYGEQDLKRTKLLYMLRAGLNKSIAAALLGVHRSSVQYWCKVLNDLAGGVKVEDVIVQSGDGEERVEN